MKKNRSENNKAQKEPTNTSPNSIDLEELSEPDNNVLLSSLQKKKKIFQFAKYFSGSFLGLNWSFWLLLTAFFTFLVIVFTWPLVLNFNTHIPGDGNVEDRYRNLWNLWWIRRALFNFDNPYQTTVLFYPYFNSTHPLPLYFQDLQLLNGLLTMPLQIFGGLASAYNGIIFLSFVMSGVGAFALAFHLSQHKLGSLFGAIFYTFNLEHLGAINISTTNIMSTQYLAPYILFNILWLEQRKKRYAILGGLSLAACVYTDWYNTLALVFYAFFYFTISSILIIAKKCYKELFRLLIPNFLGIFLASPLIISTYANLNNPVILPQLGINRDLRASLDIITLFNIFLPDSLIRLVIFLVSFIFLIFIGKKLSTSKFLFWFSFYLLCLIFSLGPQLQLFPSENPEPSGFPMPYLVLKLIPGFSIFRAPDRFIIPANLACGILLALVIAFLQLSLKDFVIKNLTYRQAVKIINKKILYKLGFFLLIVAYLLLIYPNSTRLNSVEPFGFVKWLQQNPNQSLENYQLLELPITRHYQYDHPRMYNQLWHNRPINGGFLARPVIDPYRQPESAYNWLAQQRYYEENYKKEILSEQLIFNTLSNLALLDRYKYVVLYREAYRYDWEYERIKKIIVNQFGSTSLLFEDKQNAVYSTATNLENLKPGIWLGDGFYDVESNQDGSYRWLQQEANFYVISAAPKHLTIQFDTLSFTQPRQMQIIANGQPVFNDLIRPEQSKITINYNLEIPGIVHFQVKSLSGVQSAKEAGYDNDNRLLSFLIRNLTVD